MGHREGSASQPQFDRKETYRHVQNARRDVSAADPLLDLVALQDFINLAMLLLLHLGSLRVTVLEDVGSAFGVAPGVEIGCALAAAGWPLRRSHASDAIRQGLASSRRFSVWCILGSVTASLSGRKCGRIEGKRVSASCRL